MLARLLTSHGARRMTAITLSAYACAAAFAGTVTLILGISREPIPWLDNLSASFVVSIFPGCFVAMAWARGRASSDRQQPRPWWWPSRAGRGEEFSLYFFGRAMPAGVKVLTITLLGVVGVSALLIFASMTFSVSAAPLAAHRPWMMCVHRLSNHGAVLCRTAAQEAATQATFPVIALAFDLAICTICTSGLLEQRSWQHHGVLTRQTSGATRRPRRRRSAR